MQVWNNKLELEIQKKNHGDICVLSQHGLEKHRDKEKCVKSRNYWEIKELIFKKDLTVEQIQFISQMLNRFTHFLTKVLSPGVISAIEMKNINGVVPPHYHGMILKLIILKGRIS